MSWTGIDPSHINLQHLGNDHSTTRATGESSYFCIVANLFLLINYKIEKRISYNRKVRAFLAQAGIDPAHLHLKHFRLTSTPRGPWLNAVTFPSYLILFFYLVLIFKFGEDQTQNINSAATGGNRFLPFRTETLWLDHYTMRVVAESIYFSIIL